MWFRSQPVMPNLFRHPSGHAVMQFVHLACEMLIRYSADSMTILFFFQKTPNFNSWNNTTHALKAS